MYINNDINYIKFLKKKNVWIFCAGQRGMLCKNLLQKNSINVLGFIDNYATKNDAYDVKSLEEWHRIEDKNSMIVISSHEKDIKQQLLDNDIYNFVAMSQIDFGGGVEHYDEDYFEWQRPLNEFGAQTKMPLFEPYIKPDMTVVEFGCSSGALLSLVKAKKRIGIEINPVARKAAESHGISCVATAEEIEDESVDLIISTSVLEHVENPLGELRSLYKILKFGGGGAIFYVPNESCETEYFRSDFNNHLFTWNCLNIGNLFKAAGFFVRSVERIQEIWPKNFMKLREELSKEMFDEICYLGGRVENENRCLIVAEK